jgi:hypothetical protein
MSKSDATQQKAVFSYSITKLLISATLLSIFYGVVMLGLASEYLSGVVGLKLFSSSVVVEILLVSGSVIMFRMRVRTVELYDESLRITGRKTNVRVPYSQVTNASSRAIRWFGISLPFKEIYVSIEGQSKPFPIRDARNRKLNTDLFSWLAAKLGSLPVNEGNSTD